MCSDVLSIVSLIITVILGGGAMYQSWKYNKDTEKIAEDTKYMLVHEITLINDMCKELKKEDTPMIIDLSKDKFKLHKLSTFKKRDIDKIMEIINHLSIKPIFVEKIRKFLESNEIEYECNFRGKALADEKIELSRLYEMLLKYNLLVEIQRG